MAITALEARVKIRDDLAAAGDQLELAVGFLVEAFERLDVGSADRLEAELYRPVQKALGRCKRTYTSFADRQGLPPAEGGSAPPGGSPHDVKLLVERAVTGAADADRRIAELQDSMLPIESGDVELRAGLSEVRELLAVLPDAARQFLRTLGR